MKCVGVKRQDEKRTRLITRLGMRSGREVHNFTFNRLYLIRRMNSWSILWQEMLRTKNKNTKQTQLETSPPHNVIPSHSYSSQSAAYDDLI